MADEINHGWTQINADFVHIDNSANAITRKFRPVSPDDPKKKAVTDHREISTAPAGSRRRLQLQAPV
jgi:hypothetical protein